MFATNAEFNGASFAIYRNGIPHLKLNLKMLAKVYRIASNSGPGIYFFPVIFHPGH